ncbi:GNAT family N-acetyltransferase [Bifidobacteriaceae bacterium NR002]|nr:GNAT family N-acetyltransferase [Bifidobacteriaceae bacterium NR002]MDZ7549342.1 GNAT family N-acetyltransferase [Bifidobacteriaceae bacterium NR047]
MTVEFRDVHLGDIDAIVKEYERTWGISKEVGQDASLSLSRRFVLHYLEPSTHGTIAEVDGKFMGLLLARVFDAPVMFPEVRSMLLEQEREMKSQNDENYARALEEAYAMRALETKLEAKSHINDLTQAELELFLVSPDARGHGVGGGLWRHTMHMLRNNGVNRYYLHTDSACDVSFYDYHGLSKDASWLHKDHPYDIERAKSLVEDLYIYSGEPMVRSKRANARSNTKA